MSLAEQVKQYKDGEILKVVDVLLPIFRSNSSVYYRKRLISEDLRKRLGEKLSALQNILTDLELPDVHPLVLDKILIILNKAFRSQNAHSSERVDEDPYELLIDAILLLSQQKEIDSKTEILNGRIESLNDNFNAFQNEIANDKEKCQKSREEAEAYLEKIKKIFGAVSMTTKVGIASAEARHNRRIARKLSATSIALMGLYILWLGGSFFWQPAPMVLSDYFLSRLTLAIPVAALFWYFASLAQRYRERGFQQKDFELNTSTLNGVFQSFGISDGDLNEVDKEKLELLKSFYDRQMGSNKSCGTQVPQETVKTICEIIKAVSEVKKS